MWWSILQIVHFLVQWEKPIILGTFASVVHEIVIIIDFSYFCVTVSRWKINTEFKRFKDEASSKKVEDVST